MLYPWTGILRTLLRLLKILSTTSGSLLEPNSVAMMDCRMSAVDGKTVWTPEKNPAIIHTVWRQSGWGTLLLGNLQWLSVAEGALAPPGCVHLVLQAAVDNTKLHLQPNSGAVENELTLQSNRIFIRTVYFLVVWMRLTCFLTENPMEMATKGNLKSKTRLMTPSGWVTPRMGARDVWMLQLHLENTCQYNDMLNL